MSDAILIFSILALTFFMISMTFLLIGFFRSRPIKHYDRTNGVIIKRERHYSFNLYKLINNAAIEDHVPADQRPTVLYKVEGKEYTYTSSISQQPGLKIGTEVNVFYDRYRPDKAIIDTFIQRGTVFTLVGIILGIICIIFLSVIAFLLF